MSSFWHYSIGEERFGPIPETELIDLVETGKVRPDDLAWQEGMHDWQEPRKIPIFQERGGRGWSRKDRGFNDRDTTQRRGEIPPDTNTRKIVAGLLAILLGSLGVHKFYLGFPTAGIITLACTILSWALAIVSCGLLFFLPMVPGIISLVEGIIYLAKSEATFHQHYDIEERQWF